MRAALLVLALAGCLAPVSLPDDLPASEVEPPSDPLAYLASLDLPVLPDAERTLTDLAAYVEQAPRRFDNMEDHDTARDILESAYADIGLEVRREAFTGPAQTPGMGQVGGQNILAVLPGHDSQRILMFGGHYDGAFNGYGGAYDDGLGTYIAVGLARAMAAYAWNHTLVFAAWDQEEAGLVGSRAHAQALREQTDSELSLFMNFDMTGISWPAKWLGVQDITIKAGFGGDGEERFAALWDVAREHLGYPAASTAITTGLGTGSSDHGSFREADLPAAWVRGALIGNYPGYHNADTVDTMIANVGGDRADLVAGIDATLQLVFMFALLVDADLP